LIRTNKEPSKFLPESLEGNLEEGDEAANHEIRTVVSQVVFRMGGE